MYTPDKIILQMLRSNGLANGDSHEIGKYFNDGFSPKLPEPELLEYGEIALNIAKGHEVIAIKNYEGEIICIPFDIAARVLSDEESIASLSAYTVSSLSELSGITADIYETIDELRHAIDVEIAEAVSLLDERIAGVDSKVDALSADTQEKIDALSDNIGEVSAFTKSVSDSLGSLSDEVDAFKVEFVEFSGDTSSRIDTLSADTQDRIDTLSGNVESISASTESLSGSVESLSGEVGTFREEFTEFSGETDSRLDFLEDNISGSTEIRERLDEIELVHAGAFAAFEMATGLDTNVHYNPSLPSLSGMNMTEAIDHVGGYGESLAHETQSIRNGVVNDELVHAAAFARMNHSLGFNSNAEYVPSESSSGITDMNVTEAIDYLYGNTKYILDYLGIQDTKQIVRSIRYEKLYQLYKEKNLISGMMYRITNYQATVNNVEYYGEFTTRIPVVDSEGYTSMGFDIIVRALSESELDENALIARASGNRSYFSISKLNAWQAKYCIENDKHRFDWATDNGFGVIYWLKDEYGNEAPYDFKNIVRINGGRRLFLFTDGTFDISLRGNASCNVVNANVGINGIFSLPQLSFVGTRECGNIVASNADGILFDGDFIGCWISSDVSGTVIEGPRANEFIGYSTTVEKELKKDVDRLVADGTTTTMSLSTSMEFVGTTVDVTVTATCSNDGIISIRESGGSKNTSPSEVTSFAKTFYSVSSDKTFIADYTIRGIETPEKSASITFVYPIYYGASENYTGLINISHRASKRSSLAGTYNVTVYGTPTYVWFIIPQTMGLIRTAKMGGFDFSLNDPINETIDGVGYYVYRTPQRQEIKSYSILLT